MLGQTILSIIASSWPQGPKRLHLWGKIYTYLQEMEDCEAVFKDTAGLPAGTYVAVVQSAGQVFASKLFEQAGD